MVRLVGVDLPRNKKIEYALTYIHGIGLTSAKKIVELAKVNPETKSNDLTTEELIASRHISGSEIRKSIGIRSKKTKEFREGAVWAMQNQRPGLWRQMFTAGSYLNPENSTSRGRDRGHLIIPAFGREEKSCVVISYLCSLLSSHWQWVLVIRHHRRYPELAR